MKFTSMRGPLDPNTIVWRLMDEGHFGDIRVTANGELVGWFLCESGEFQPVKRSQRIKALQRLGFTI